MQNIAIINPYCLFGQKQTEQKQTEQKQTNKIKKPKISYIIEPNGVKFEEATRVIAIVYSYDKDKKVLHTRGFCI